MNFNMVFIDLKHFSLEFEVIQQWTKGKKKMIFNNIDIDREYHQRQ